MACFPIECLRLLLDITIQYLARTTYLCLRKGTKKERLNRLGSSHAMNVRLVTSREKRFKQVLKEQLLLFFTLCLLGLFF